MRREEVPKTWYYCLEIGSVKDCSYCK